MALKSQTQLTRRLSHHARQELETMVAQPPNLWARCPKVQTPQISNHTSYTSGSGHRRPPLEIKETRRKEGSSECRKGGFPDTCGWCTPHPPPVATRYVREQRGQSDTAVSAFVPCTDRAPSTSHPWPRGVCNVTGVKQHRAARCEGVEKYSQAFLGQKG